MAHIVCKYDLPGCRWLGLHPVMTYYNEWCGKDMRGNCNEYQPTGKYTKRVPINGEDREFELTDEKCRHFVWRHHEIETTVKNYEYSENVNENAGLKIKGKFIDLDFIDYLEIDGKVLIGTKV